LDQRWKRVKEEVAQPDHDPMASRAVLVDSRALDKQRGRPQVVPRTMALSLEGSPGQPSQQTGSKGASTCPLTTASNPTFLLRL
jgi:hypothetical protein